MTYIVRVVDFETNGEAPPAQVCEVGICDVEVATRRVLAGARWFCGGIDTMPAEARAVHHIRLSDLVGAEPFDPAMFDIGPHFAFAAHNAEFELQFIQPTKPMICTYKAALRVWPDAPKHTNGALFYWLEDLGLIEPDHALAQPSHRAGPDAYVTAHILAALFRAGVTGQQMVQWTREPTMYPRCPLGKWKGKPWPEVEDGFLNWMLRTADMAEDLKWNARREIERRGGGNVKFL